MDLPAQSRSTTSVWFRRPAAGWVAAACAALVVVGLVDRNAPDLQMAPLAAIPLVIIGYYGNLVSATLVALLLTGLFGYMDFGPPAGAHYRPANAVVDALMLGVGFLALAVTADLLRRESHRRVAVERSLEDLRRREREQHDLARRDALCPVANRIAFDEFLDRAFAAERRAAIAVIFVDLDGFKCINDTHGHRVGDRVLTIAAERLSCAVRTSSDVVARIGGDEFAIVLTHASEAAALSVIAKIVRLFAQPFAVDGRTLAVAASCGYALSGRDGDDADALLHVADARMYRNKLHARDGGPIELSRRPAS